MTALNAPPVPKLGTWIREIRRELKWSQTRLAKEIGMDVTQADISRWERGMYAPNVFEMRRLAEVTGADYLNDLRTLPSEWTHVLAGQGYEAA